MMAWEVVVRAVHIFAASIALVVAPAALATVKGSRWHRRWGKGYFWAMAVVASTGIALAIHRGNLFLMLIGVFSFYLAFSGYRVILLKARRGTLLDWTFVSLAIAGSAGLIATAMFMKHLGPVAIVFGALGLLFAFADVRRLRNPPVDARARFLLHLRSMLAAYIATVSAFSVVNLSILPLLVRWLWPTAIGIVAITLLTRRYRDRFAPRAP